MNYYEIKIILIFYYNVCRMLAKKVRCCLYDQIQLLSSALRYNTLWVLPMCTNIRIGIVRVLHVVS